MTSDQWSLVASTINSQASPLQRVCGWYSQETDYSQPKGGQWWQRTSGYHGNHCQGARPPHFTVICFNFWWNTLEKSATPIGILLSRLGWQNTDLGGSPGSDGGDCFHGSKKPSSLPPARRAPPQRLQQLTVSLFLSAIWWQWSRPVHVLRAVMRVWWWIRRLQWEWSLVMKWIRQVLVLIFVQNSEEKKS